MWVPQGMCVGAEIHDAKFTNEFIEHKYEEL